MASRITVESFEDMLHSIHYISRTLERIETVLNDIKDTLNKKEGS